MRLKPTRAAAPRTERRAWPRGPVAFAGVVAAACVALLVTFPIYDSDLWQHLVVGRTIWQTHSIPTTHLWSWPMVCQPEVLPSWLFRAMLWPFYAAADGTGIFVWRWLTTFAIFGLAWRLSRRMGASGPWAFVAIVWCAMLFRYRSMARPDTLVGVLMMAQLWLLETRRLARGSDVGVDRAWWLVPIAWVWANAHISYYMGFVISGIYLLDALLRARRGGPSARPRTLALVMLACAAVSFVNPFGWRALWQPFEYFLIWRHEPIFMSIGELLPPDWSVLWRSSLQLFLVLVPALAILRWFRRGFDLVQCLLLLFLLPQALAQQRFLGYLGIALAPFFARDLDDAIRSIRWPRALAHAWSQAVLVAALCIGLSIPELTSPGVQPGFGFVWDMYPVRACDYIEANGVRGRSFNAFAQAGYLLWRFWPDRGRLPFMDIHQTGTRADRYAQAYAASDERAWRDLDGRRRFDWVILPRDQEMSSDLPNFLDADSTTWALVFVDAGAALYLRRDGSMAAVADRDRYRYVCAGLDRLGAVGRLAAADTAARRAIRAEVARAIDSSPHNAQMLGLMANVDLLEARWDDARRNLERARAVQRDLPLLHDRLGLALLYGGDPTGALREFRLERGARKPSPAAELHIGQALSTLGRWEEARAAYRQALARPETSDEARDSLAAIERRGAR